MVNCYRIKRTGTACSDLEDEDMMKSKKFWALLLALAMVLSLAACGGKSDGGAAKDTPPADTSAPADTSTPPRAAISRTATWPMSRAKAPWWWA